MKMEFKNATDFRVSLEARLKNIAIQHGQDLQRIRRKLAFERLLARIFYQNTHQFVLKGGYAMELRFSTARATKDIDLTCLARLTEDFITIDEMIVIELRKLAKIDLNDFFTFEIGPPKKDLDNAPYGGARYAVSSFIDQRLFVRFQLDVGADALIDKVEKADGVNWLEFCGIDTPQIHMISVEQQFAEKLHAYSLPRHDRTNTHVKDLVDLLLLHKRRKIDPISLNRTLKKVFVTRNTHKLPSELSPPPKEWETSFAALADECGLEFNLIQAYEEISDFYKSSVTR